MLMNKHIQGTLQGYLYNTYTARKEGVQSTGNASRGGISGTVGVGISNLFLEPVSSDHIYSMDKLFSLIDRGLYITDAMGVHTANAISGDFSIGVNGVWFEGGKSLYPVKEAIISGNILELFQHIEGAGNDMKSYGKLGSPSLFINNVDVSA